MQKSHSAWFKALRQIISQINGYMPRGLAFVFFATQVFASELTQSNPNTITPNQVAVVVNKQDANSVIIGDYYLNARDIPRRNLIIVDIAPGLAALNADQFQALRETIFSKIKIGRASCRERVCSTV